MSRSKDRGTAAETAGVEYLQSNGFPFAERIALHGNKDRGDIKVCPGVIAEAKNCKTLKLPAWFAELAEEIENANAKHGFLLIKPEGIGRTRVGQWWAGMTVQGFSDLHEEAGLPGLIPAPVWLPGHRYKSELPGRIAELRDHPEFGFVGVRGALSSDVSSWYVMTQLEQIVGLLRMAGYGSEVLA